MVYHYFCVMATHLPVEATDVLFMVQDSDMVKQTEVPLDNFSDEE